MVHDIFVLSQEGRLINNWHEVVEPRKVGIDLGKYSEETAMMMRVSTARIKETGSPICLPGLVQGTPLPPGPVEREVYRRRRKRESRAY